MTWAKTNPPPNISCRYFTYSTEFIIWARKSAKKPHLTRIILASTDNGAWILDPFSGSSTTGIAANMIGRRFLGIEKETEFADISRMRREEIDNIKICSNYRSKIKDIAKYEAIEPTCMVCEEKPFMDLPF